MLNAPLRIMIVAGLCVLGLIGLVVREGYERSRPATATSHDIELRMQAIDPRALLSGHYVIVSLQGRYTHPAGAEPCADFTAAADNEAWIAITDTSPHLRVPDPTLPRDLSPVGTAATREAAQAIADTVRPGGLAVRGRAYCSELPDETIGPGAISVSTVQLTLPGVARFYAPLSWHCLLAGYGTFPDDTKMLPPGPDIEMFDLDRIDDFIRRTAQGYPDHKALLMGMAS